MDSIKKTKTVIDSFNATAPSAPKYCFGYSERSGIPIDESCTPGPGEYSIKSSLVKNFSSTYRSPPSFSLKGRTLFGSPDFKSCSKAALSEPGPGAYKISKYAGNERKPPSYSFPRSSWEKVAESELKSSVPGPGMYQLSSGVGKQVLSNKKSSESFSFGVKSKMVVKSTDNVGPGDYIIPGDIGQKQIDSRKPTRLAPKIAAATMKTNAAAWQNKYCEDSFYHVPGAGAYQIPSTLCRHPQSNYRSPPVVRLSGREKFGSPF